MSISQGVEWSAHACALLAAVPEGWCLSGAALAAFHDLPPAYMAKHLQALSRAGLLKAGRGPQGGYRLARPGDEVTLLDVEQAILDYRPRFECQNIRARGPCALRESESVACEIACAFWQAEAAYQAALRSTTMADIARSVAARRRALGRSDVQEWIRANAARVAS
jgi:Rrf2 family protein